MADSDGVGSGAADGGMSVVWDGRYRDGAARVPQAAAVLRDNAHLLPLQGRALELACGLGGNALLLAAAGLSVQAWDFSAVALEALSAAAASASLSIKTEVRDVVQRPPQPDSFDVIVVSHYLQRELAPGLVAALRPGGLLFYQTFTRAKVGDGGPRNPAYRLAPNELLQLFAGLELLVYREEGTVGDPRRGFRNEAMLVGRKQGTE